jgi:2,3-bisphosphoglycerate-independent phosphoglycerate mutase
MKTCLLIILDGLGINPDPKDNAVAQAQAPTLKKFLNDYPHTELQASENSVGLPKTFMGNSEVGHLNIGAGRIVYQDFSLISKAIEEGTFFKNPVFLTLFQTIKAKKGRLHLMGLVSDGGVHSHIIHLLSLLQMAKKEGISEVFIHAFMDGRDTSPTSGAGFMETVQKEGIGTVASVQGRFYAMDRDSRWERTEKAFAAISAGVAEEKFSDPVAYIRAQYASAITDEFLTPAVRQGYSGVQDGDGILFYNFRADRARQLTRAFTQSDFSNFPRLKFPVLSGFVSMTPYDAIFRFPAAYQKAKVPMTLGELVSLSGGKQLRIAETEKYAHVTYFFNGGEERVFEGEKRVLVPSPREVKTYDLKPEMNAVQVTDTLLKELAAQSYDLVVLNFANPDMVGHTGNIPAAIRAVETVDKCLERILKWALGNGAFIVLTADHGNCEMMRDAFGAPLTSHSLLPVPFSIAGYPEKLTLRKGGKLCDIAPTLLALWGKEAPREMTGKSLIV